MIGGRCSWVCGCDDVSQRFALASAIPVRVILSVCCQVLRLAGVKASCLTLTSWHLDLKNAVERLVSCHVLQLWCSPILGHGESF